MKKSNEKKNRPSKTKEPKRKDRVIRILRIKKDDDLKTIYAKYRKSFTAADLQRYTEDEPMFPAEPLIKELEDIHREEMRRQKRKKADNGRTREWRVSRSLLRGRWRCTS
jgi:hypothetical protein